MICFQVRFLSSSRGPPFSDWSRYKFLGVDISRQKQAKFKNPESQGAIFRKNPHGICWLVNPLLKTMAFTETTFTHLKFNSSPLKSYRNPIGKDRLPTTIFKGRTELNFGGVNNSRLGTLIGKRRKGSAFFFVFWTSERDHFLVG